MKSPKDQVFLIKSEEKFSAEEVVERVASLKSLKVSPTPLDEVDSFVMPNVSIKHKRDLNELLGKRLKNKKFTDYMFSQVYEIIKLDIDETGVKAENEGVIRMKNCMVIKQKVEPKHIVIDRSFWVLMKEAGKEPYLVSYIAEVKD